MFTVVVSVFFFALLYIIKIMSEKGGLFGKISPATKKVPQYGYVPCPRSEEVGSDILALFQQKGKLFNNNNTC